MKNIIITLILTTAIWNGNILKGQVGIDTSSPNTNALLELNSTNKGWLPPRISLVNTTSASPLSQHVKGMIVYNTVSNALVSEGLYMNNGAQWFRLSTSDIPKGHIKYSVQASDHNGWYLLDGRAVSSLPAAVQATAVSLGFPANIPNASGRYLKAKTGAEVLGASGGNSSFTLTQTNLPAITFTGTALSAGNHFHTYVDRGSSSVNGGGAGNDNADDTSGTFNTSTAGAHTHTFTVPTGGTNTPVSIDPKHLNLNVFVYLGS
ncbi:hypothetical protein [Chryseobacterium viscerum]|uniref:Phage tail protein n=1 Tax=Chryseobacterium viscerum TaxID=1037377 RepID=A0A5N4BSN7_9FLAO|nr:hypothetical protein [Chryseobacterium viscerum]KAB1231412.1 hypothetical protein F8D52_06275 [Chryseobacterium viscerum]